MEERGEWRRFIHSFILHSSSSNADGGHTHIAENVAIARYALGLGYNTCMWLRECCSQVEAEVIGYSRNKISPNHMEVLFPGPVVLCWQIGNESCLAAYSDCWSGSPMNQLHHESFHHNLFCFRCNNISRPRFQTRRLSLLHLLLHPSSSSEERPLLAGHCEDTLEDTDPTRVAILQV